MKIFIITLPEAKGRQDHMRAQMKAQGLAFEFFDAVDGRNFDVPSHPVYNATLRRLFFGRDMKGGEIGVLLSHKAIYQKMIDEGIEKALVFEDDAILEPNFAIVAQALVNTQSNYDLVRFLGSEKVSKLEQKIVQPLWGVYTMNKLRTAPGGAFAYSVTLQGARKMLNVLDKVYLPIDTLMGHGWLNNMQNYIVQPGLANQDLSQEQFIGDARFDKQVALEGWMRFIFPLTRAGFKLYEAIMKQIWYRL